MRNTPRRTPKNIARNANFSIGLVGRLVLAGTLGALGCGGGGTLQTDAGANPSSLWSARPAAAGADWQAVWGSGQDIFLAGKGDTVARSHDGGATWSFGATGAIGGGASASSLDFRDLAGTSGADVWLVGSAAAASGSAVGESSVVLRSADGGASWQRRDAGITGAVRAVWALDAGRVLAATGDGRVWRSTDGGGQWSAVYAGTGATGAAALFDLWGLPSGEAYAVGRRAGGTSGGASPDGGAGEAGDGPGIVLGSTDGGATWTEVAVTPLPARTLWRVWGTPNGNAVYAAGAGATVAWTLDHGATWRAQGKAISTADIDLTNVWVTPDDGGPFFASPRGLVRNIEYMPTGAIQFGTEGLPPAAGGEAIPTAIWGTRTDDVWAVGAHGALWHRP